jgi:hemolysin D
VYPFLYNLGALAQAEGLKRQREQTRAEFEKTVLSDLATAQQKEGELKTDTDKGVERVSLMTLKAPITGTVQQLAVHTIGGVVTPAQSLLVLAPDAGGLILEARIQNKDIGFVKAGQEAQVKIETFSFTRYGLIHGRVLDVSRDAEAGPGAQKTAAKAAGSRGQAGNDGLSGNGGEENDAADSAGYVAHVALDQTSMMTENGPVPLGPGMKVAAEIKTGKRTVISYLLSPVFRYKQESLRER